MPRHPIESAYRDGIAALRALAPDGASPAREMTLKGLISLQRDLPPGWQALRHTLHSEEPTLLASLLDLHGTEPYRKIQSSPDTWANMSPIFERQDLDTLRLLLRRGININTDFNAIRQAVIESNNPEVFEFAAFEAGLSEIFFGPNWFVPMVRMKSGPAGRWIGEAFARLPKDTQDRCLRELGESIALIPRMKTLAFAIATGRNVAKFLPHEDLIEHFLPYYGDILKQNASAHGRLAQLAQLGSLAEVAAQPENGSFLGQIDLPTGAT